MAMLEEDGGAGAGAGGLSALEPPPYTIDLQFDDLGLTLKSNGRSVLAGVSGGILHGRVTAVMGPSGAGKSTFLTTLCDKATYGRRTGRLFVNGGEGTLQPYKRVVGFVPQEDVMHRELTVKEILTFSAQLRLPGAMSRAAKRRRVNQVIKVLGLRDIRHDPIGDETRRGISGGQRKRVNIGMELVADPTVLFLDEPTSGLDSTSSMEVCQALRDIAGLGLTVATVIHQPRYEIFRMFHDVLLLGKGGRTVYLGASERALPYFEQLGFRAPEHTNPPDFFMDVISGDVPCAHDAAFEAPQLFALWEKHKADFAHDLPLPPPGSVDRPPRPRGIAGRAEQVVVFTYRGLMQHTRAWGAVIFDVVLVLVSGVFLGLIYYQRFYVGPEPRSVVEQCPAQLLREDPSPCKLPRDDPLSGQACVASLALALSAVAGSLRVFGSAKPVFWRESSTGVSTLAYFIGQNLAHTPILLAAPLVFLLLFYQLVTPLASFGSYYLILFLVYWTAAGWGYFVSIVAPPSQAQLFGVLFVLFNMMFSGALPRFAQLRKVLGGVLMIPTYISYIRWAQEAFYLNEIYYYQDVYDDVQSGMDLYEYKFDDFNLCIWMVFVIGAVGRLCSYTALALKDRDKRK